MNKRLSKQPGEKLYLWIERLSEHIASRRLDKAAIHDILHEVSVQSYIEGVHAERELELRANHY